MKRKNLLLLVVLLFIISVHGFKTWASDYKPILVNGREFKMASVHEGLDGDKYPDGYERSPYYSISVIGDTIVDGKSCKALSNGIIAYEKILA